MKKSRKRSREQVVKHRLQISEMYLRGMSQFDIGQNLGINQGTVSRDLAALRKEWLASSLRNFNDARSEELAKIDQQERNYHITAGKIREYAQKLVTLDLFDKATSALGQSLKAMNGVDSCIDRRCRILGLDAPEKHATGAGVNLIQIVGADPGAL